MYKKNKYVGILKTAFCTNSERKQNISKIPRPNPNSVVVHDHMSAI